MKNSLANRVAQIHFTRTVMAKATGTKTGDGDGVGLFIPLPKDLAKQFPSLGDNDDSPSHVTFVYLGDFETKPEQKKVLEVLKRSLQRWWPKCRATLGQLEYFDHHDKNRRVPHMSVDFDKDMAGLKFRLRQELAEAGIPVKDSFPEYKPHVTLAYLPGMDSEWTGVQPQGTWEFSEVEVWGLPTVHKLKLGPSIYKISDKWAMAREVALQYEGSSRKKDALKATSDLSRDLPKLASEVATQFLHGATVGYFPRMSSHERSTALMRWLGALAQRLGVGRDTYVVGGAVRNHILQKSIKDVDIVIDTTKAGHNSAWLAEQIAKAVPVPTNVTTNQYGVAILTIKGEWVLDGENLKGEVIEIADARKESYGGAEGKGYKPHSVEPATIEEDVYRREFTFNTLLWRLMDLVHGPDKAEIVDLTGCGIHDLAEGNLRCPRDPDVVFSDDPTRMLRAIKFTGRYDFKIPPDVVASIRRNAPKMKRMPWEAIATLLVGEVLAHPAARKSLQQMKDLGLLDVVHEMIVEQKPFATYMANQLRTNRKVQLLLDMMDLGMPANMPISFLDAAGQQRLREITVTMPEDEAAKFVDLLIKPPVDNTKVITDLDLQGAARGQIIPRARALLLKDPSLAHDGHRLTEVLLRTWT